MIALSLHVCPPLPLLAGPPGFTGDVGEEGPKGLSNGGDPGMIGGGIGGRDPVLFKVRGSHLALKGRSHQCCSK